MQAVHVFAGLAVRGFDTAIEWYERLFGRPPDMRPKAGEAVWRLADEASVYVVVYPPRAGTGLLTVALDDLDAYVAALAERGIVTRPEDPGKAVAADPDGNEIGFFAAA